MEGLVWQWDGEQLELIQQLTTPTGPSYVGAVLKKKTDP